MRRVCLLVEDQPELRLVLDRMLRGVFRRAWGDGHSIEILTAESCAMAHAILRDLGGDEGVRLVLVTDYDLGDGYGSELIAACQQLFGRGRSLQVLQSGTQVTDLLGDPVVRDLPPAFRLAKPVKLLVFEGLMPAFGELWGLSLEG